MDSDSQHSPNLIERSLATGFELLKKIPPDLTNALDSFNTTQELINKNCKIATARDKRDLLLGMGWTLQGLGEYKKAFDSYKKIFKCNSDKEILLKTGYCQYLMGRLDAAEKTYWKAINLDKKSFFIHYEALYFYITVASQKAISLLNQYKKNMPDAKGKHRKMDWLVNHQSLIVATKQCFSYFQSIKISKFYQTIELPQKLSQVFNHFSVLSGQVYLVGKTLRQLLLNHPIEHDPKIADCNFVYADKHVLPEFLELGFVKKRTYQNSCIKKINGETLNLWHFSPDNTDIGIFTIDYIFCDKDGGIYDPTKMGIIDAKNKILRTTGVAQDQFAQNAFRVLDAIKHIALGYTPTPEVAQALKEWAGPSAEQVPNIKSMLREMKEDATMKEKYDLLFCEYNMNNKFEVLALEENMVNMIFALEYNAPIIFSDRKINSYTQNLQEEAIKFINLSELNKKLSSIKL